MSQLKLTADGGGGTVAIKGPASTTGNNAFELTVPGTASGTILTSNSDTGSVLKVVHKMDGTRSSTTTAIQDNAFTSGLELSNLTATITPTDATTVFIITGSLQLDHPASYVGKLWITYQISGGSEQMIAGNGDTARRCTATFHGANIEPGISCQPVSFSLVLDHNTTSAITIRARIATTNSTHGKACYNRDVNDTQNGGDGAGTLSSLCITEYVGSAVTASDTTIYRGT
tara:strand:+ start:246 stop:935 length:690 start_codon:yes stop_codon:yes gene_type:complete